MMQSLEAADDASTDPEGHFCKFEPGSEATRTESQCSVATQCEWIGGECRVKADGIGDGRPIGNTVAPDEGAIDDDFVEPEVDQKVNGHFVEKSSRANVLNMYGFVDLSADTFEFHFDATGKVMG